MFAKYVNKVLFDVVVAGWQETFRSTASLLTGDFLSLCQPAGSRPKNLLQPAGRRHFQNYSV